MLVKIFCHHVRRTRVSLDWFIRRLRTKFASSRISKQARLIERQFIACPLFENAFAAVESLMSRAKTRGVTTSGHRRPLLATRYYQAGALLIGARRGPLFFITGLPGRAYARPGNNKNRVGGRNRVIPHVVKTRTD